MLIYTFIKINFHECVRILQEKKKTVGILQVGFIVSICISFEVE